MSSPRKFAEKIALIQQKQAEGDAAFQSIIHEVEVAKQKADRPGPVRNNLNVPTRAYEMPNRIDYQNSNNYFNQSTTIETNNNSNLFLLPADNSPWRRTHSDSSLNQTVMPNTIGQNVQLNNIDNNQPFFNDANGMKSNAISYSAIQPTTNLQMSGMQLQPQLDYDFNNNNNNNHFYINNAHSSPHTLSVPQQPIISSVQNANHAALNSRYDGGNNDTNHLTLPPNQHMRGGGSLPDLRAGNIYNNQQMPCSTMPTSASATVQHFRSTSPQPNGDQELYTLGPQQQTSSRLGPVKSPTTRRRHSPIGDIRQLSPRRQLSPSPDVSPSPQTHHCVEPTSPQSLSSYSSQNSPNISPGSYGEHAPFPSSQQQPIESQQLFYALPNQFDQISLESNFFVQPQPASPSSQPTHNHLSSSPITNDLQQQRNFYQPIVDNISSTYNSNPPKINTAPTTPSQRSPTIPNIILTDADSKKVDLINDFDSSLDELLNGSELQLNSEDFMLNELDLTIDPVNCDDTFGMSG